MLKVDFSSKNIASVNVYRYDYGQQLEISGITLPDTFEMHFQKGDGEAEPRTGTYNSETGIGIVPIPDCCLEQDVRMFKAWLWIENKTSGKTLRTVEFRVSTREKAAGKPSTSDIAEVKSYTKELKEYCEDTLNKAQLALNNRPRKLYTPPDNANAEDNPFGDAPFVYLRDIINTLSGDRNGTPGEVFDAGADFYLLDDENWEENSRGLFVHKGDIFAIEYQGSTDGWSYIMLFDRQGIFTLTNTMDNWMENGQLVTVNTLLEELEKRDNQIETLTVAVKNLNDYVNELRDAIISLGGEV